MASRNRSFRPIGSPRRKRSVNPALEDLESRVVLSGSSIAAAAPTVAPSALIRPTYVVYHPSGTPATAGQLTPDGYSGPPTDFGYSPAQIRTAYAVNNITFGGVKGDGTGQTIAIVDAYDDPAFVDSSINGSPNPAFISSDLAQFDKEFGLPNPPSFTKVNQEGQTSPLPSTDPAGAGNYFGNWEIEEALDVEWAHAIAPGANIILVEANDASNNLFIAAQTAASLPGVSVVSMSWGEPEQYSETSMDSIFAVPGVTFVASTGDQGSPGEYPAYSPNVVAVGGTSLQNLDANGDYPGTGANGEVAWSFSGGGISQVESEPSYQDSVQSTGQRTIPDVSFDADPNTGVPIYDSYNNVPGSWWGDTGPWEQIGGTSLSAPAWAGLITIANQGRASVGLGPLDGASQTLPMLYQMPSTNFHDITIGSNGYAAGPGYDLVTGLGSPIANLLINFNQMSSTTTSVVSSAASLVSGQSVTFMAKVAAVSPSAPTPTGGTVTFRDGSVTLGTASLVNGTAALSTQTLGLGGHTITASYSGNSPYFAASASGTVATVAGTGVAGYGGDGGPATAAGLNNPTRVAVDTAGDLFIADTSNDRIREVVKATGDIITVAGTGVAGDGGDGGPATAALLNNPIGVAVDAAGDLFIADFSNERVREVVKATGDIITVAGTGNWGNGGDGGRATAAQLNAPAGVAVDTAGDIFIADTGNNRIQEVVKATGDIITVAGTGVAGSGGDGGPATAAQLYWPTGLAVDAAGDLFIGDEGNNRVQEVVKATGIIVTVAGTGVAGYGGDGGSATSAQLYHPAAVAVDAAGDLYIGDDGNNRVREVVKATGIIVTVAGTGVAGYGGDGGPATAALLSNPCGVAVDAVGDLFIVDGNNQRIREVTPPAVVGFSTIGAGTTVRTSSITSQKSSGQATYASVAPTQDPGQSSGGTVDAVGQALIANGAADEPTKPSYTAAPHMKRVARGHTGSAERLASVDHLGASGSADKSPLPVTVSRHNAARGPLSLIGHGRRRG